MPILTQDRNTPQKGRPGRKVGYLVKAGARIFAGALVATDATGFAVPAADLPGHRVVGIADTSVDNSTGANGAVRVMVLRGVFKLNQGTTSVTQVHVGGDVFVENDNQVRGSGSTNNVIAGKVDSLEPDGVWVRVPE